jgi:hypothetical protein
MPAFPSHFVRYPHPACAELTLSTLRSGSYVALGSLVAAATCLRFSLAHTFLPL